MDSSSRPAVEVCELTKCYGNRVAVDSVSFEVRAGEVLGLLGHNGAGKSSIIGCLLGQVYPTKGTVMIGGHDVFEERRRALEKVGAIFETPCFYDYMSGWDNLHYFISLTGRADSEVIDEVLELVELRDRINDPVGTYSHGMRQRLALAQALLPGPHLLILDEPADGLDPEGISEIRELIVRLNRERGLTIILCSHQLHEVEQVCHRAVILREGKLLFSGDWRQGHASDEYLELEMANRSRVLEDLVEKRWLKEVAGGHALAPETSLNQVMRYVASLGLNVKKIGLRQPDLEEIYLEYSRRNSGGLER